jgi:hypothetical protein
MHDKIKNTKKIEKVVVNRPHPWLAGHVLLVLEHGFGRWVWRNVGDKFLIIEKLGKALVMSKLIGLANAYSMLPLANNAWENDVPPTSFTSPLTSVQSSARVERIIGRLAMLVVGYRIPSSSKLSYHTSP